MPGAVLPEAHLFNISGLYCLSVSALQASLPNMKLDSFYGAHFLSISVTHTNCSLGGPSLARQDYKATFISVNINFHL